MAAENREPGKAFVEANGDIRDCEDRSKLARFDGSSILFWNRKQRREAALDLNPDTIRAMTNYQDSLNASERLRILAHEFGLADVEHHPRKV